MIDNASKTMGVSWDEMFDKNVLVFLNVCCYYNDKNELEKQQIKEYQKKGRKN